MPEEVVNSVRKTVLLFQNISLSSIQVILTLEGKYCSNDPAKISWLIDKIAHTMCFVYLLDAQQKREMPLKKPSRNICVSCHWMPGVDYVKHGLILPQTKKPTSPLPFPQICRWFWGRGQKVAMCWMLGDLGHNEPKNAITPGEQEDIGGAFHVDKVPWLAGGSRLGKTRDFLLLGRGRWLARGPNITISSCEITFQNLTSGPLLTTTFHH